MEGSKNRWTERVRTGLTDEQLEAALKYELGEMGACSAGDIGITYQGPGLRIWADHGIGSRNNPPTLQGRSTVAFARRTYGESLIPMTNR